MERLPGRWKGGISGFTGLVVKDRRARGGGESSASESLDVAAGLLDPRERYDFYHRVRSFPEDVANWRKAFARRVPEDRDLFPAVPTGASLDEVRQRIDDGIGYLRELPASWLSFTEHPILPRASPTGFQSGSCARAGRAIATQARAIIAVFIVLLL